VVAASGARDPHPGDCGAITQAAELHATCLIIDERDNRRAASDGSLRSGE